MCYHGNIVAGRTKRNLDDRGGIENGAVRESGALLRVILPDGSSCIFNGAPSGDRMAGSYICLQDSAFVERGRWEVQRSF
jgi:hypothetical protein